MSILQDLVKDMNGKPSTNQWDIVCSYTVSQLNKFLQAHYDAGKLAKEIKLSTERQDPLTGDNFTISYDIKFASPVLSFISGRSEFATLTMPINNGSSYSIIPQGATQPTKTVLIPGDKYSVKAVVPLAAISGDTGEIVEQGKVIEFSDGKVHDNYVIVHFKNEKGTSYEIVPLPDPKDKDPLVTYFLPVLAQYFLTEINEVDYALSTVNNTSPDSGLSIFTPKSFVFASMGNGDDGALSLYIQTVESNNPPGNASPSFQPGDVSVSPIPDNYTASIILSYSLITKAFLKPQLEKSGFTVLFDTALDGISAQLQKDSSVVADSKDGNYIFSGYSYKGLNISLKDHPLNFVIKESQLSLYWEGKTTSEWSQTEAGPQGGNFEYGSVNITIDLKKEPIKLSLSNDNVTLADVNISRPDFSVSTKAKSCNWKETFTGCRETVPPYYSGDMQLTIPSINIALHGFDFFRTTNLLAPGKHVIEVDAQAGVSTPHDFLMVGQVSKK